MMSENAIVDVEARTPEIIADEIKFAVDALRRYSLYAVAEIGEKLIEAKELVPHGKWSDYLKNNVNFSERTARGYMQIAEEFPRLSKTAIVADLSITNAFKLLALPEDEQNEVIEAAEVGEIVGAEVGEKIDELKARITELEDNAVANETDLLMYQDEINKAKKDAEIANTKLKAIVADTDRRIAELTADKNTDPKSDKAMEKLKSKLEELKAKAKEAESKAKEAEVKALDAEAAAARAEKERALSGSEDKVAFKLAVNDLQTKFYNAVDAYTVSANLPDEDRAKMKGALIAVLEGLIASIK
jgi:chromosome segregation ATPase